MLVTVVVLFATSWLPIYAIQIRVNFGPPLTDPTTTEFYMLTQVCDFIKKKLTQKIPSRQFWNCGR